MRPKAASYRQKKKISLQYTIWAELATDFPKWIKTLQERPNLTIKIEHNFGSVFWGPIFHLKSDKNLLFSL